MFSTTALFFIFGSGLPQIINEKFEQYVENEREKRSIEPEKITSVKCEEDKEQLVDEIEDQKHGFRDRKYIAYENRIRSYSTPDKIFRYFATLKVEHEDGSQEVFMTPKDFVRAITPGVKQPEGLDLDSYIRYDPKTGLLLSKNKETDVLNLDIPQDSIFYTLGNNALISFSDFIFLLTVLSTPKRQFEIAFRMFDLNGDGELDQEEFEMVRSIILDTTQVGKRHRENMASKPRNIAGALRLYYFGEDGKQKLTIERFLDFQEKLQTELMRIEFNRYDPEDDRINEVDFAKYLLTYAGFGEAKRKRMLKKIKSKFDVQERISFQEFVDFNQFLRSISDVDAALSFHNIAGAPIDQATFKHVAEAVSNVKLSDHVIEVVFHLFDDNNDNHLSNKEFVSVMKNRLLRGFDRPMDTGFIRFMNAFFLCAQKQFEFGKKNAREKIRV